MDSQLATLEEQRESLIMELDSTRSRLAEFENSSVDVPTVQNEVEQQRNQSQENATPDMQGCPMPEQNVVSLRYVFVPIGVVIGAYLLRRWWMNSE